MHEQSKAAKRRTADRHYTDLYFVGSGIDVGAGPDGLSRLREYYPKITDVRDWDMADGDATTLPGIPHRTFDFLSASHVLEHLEYPTLALAHWIAAVKSGGHLVITVPDWVMYERCNWPSRFGVGHRFAYTTDPSNRGQRIMGVQNLLETVRPTAALERLLVLREHFDPSLPDTVDQSMGPAECAIEIVLRKI